MKCEAMIPDGELLKGGCPRIGQFTSPVDGKEVCGLHYPIDEDPDREKGWISKEVTIEQFQDWISSAVRPPRSEEKRGLDLRGAIIRLDLDFGALVKRLQWPEISGLDATGAHFLGGVSFGNATFGVVYLDNAIFYQPISLSVSKTPIRCRNYFMFNGTVFKGPVDSEGGQFEGGFTGAKSEFKGGARFEQTSFGHLHLSGATFWGSVSFLSCTFRGYTNFSKASFLDLGEHHGVALPYQPEIISLSFSSCVIQGSVSFAESKFKVNTSFYKLTFPVSCDFRSAMFSHAPRLLIVNFEGPLLMRGVEIGPGSEDTFRTLKQAMEAQGQSWMATRFAGDELFQQLRDTPLRDRIWPDWILSFLYCITSNYGRSWWLPLFWLVVLTAICWLFYWTTCAFVVRDGAELEGWLSNLSNWPLYLRALVFALQSVKPVWLIGAPVMVATSWWAQMVVIFQSIASIVLIAMSVLAMRKRFRI